MGYHTLWRVQLYWIPGIVLVSIYIPMQFDVFMVIFTQLTRYMYTDVLDFASVSQ